MARKCGVELASGEIVALLKDTPTPGWSDVFAAKFSEFRVVAAAGPVVTSRKLERNFVALGCGDMGGFILTMRGWSYMTGAVETLAYQKVMARIFLMETTWSIGVAVWYHMCAGRSLDTWY